jgi:hypothetical protein
MEIVSLDNINKKDIPLHYRNEYSGEVVYKNMLGQKESIPVEFIVERSALGSLDISVEFTSPIDYPLLPALRSVKSYIAGLDKEGRLPW